MFIRTKGRGYVETDADGIAYYYSVFDSFDQVKAASASVHLVNTNIWHKSGKDLFRTATHIGLLARL